MKLALVLDVQTNAKGGKFMSIEDSHQGELRSTEPGNFQDDGAKRVGVCFASNTDLELWTEEVEGVIDNMIIFQKPFPGAARTELSSSARWANTSSARLTWSAASSGTRPATCRPASSRKGPALVEARLVALE